MLYSSPELMRSSLIGKIEDISCDYMTDLYGICHFTLSYIMVGQSHKMSMILQTCDYLTELWQGLKQVK